ncbi:CHAP domain-containing protein [Antribacter gilvus]|uniref:CHAP domain-containing protein n=1 Tax=Antribacter gilvus TaxID=2304675 RepID=UPI000F77EAAC|nr:CHAP domain-containing protein [Antribacter gilvus]
MSRPHVLRPLLAAAAALLCTLTGVVVAAPASAAAGTVMADPCLNIRAGATTGSAALACAPYGTSLTVQCVVYGSSVTGPYSTSTLWNRVSYGGVTGYAADAWMNTGTDGPVAGACGSGLSARVDAFVSTWNGRYADYDGYYGAQCVDLFNYYNRDVVGASWPPVSYAYQLYDTYDTSKYTRVSASSAPRKGDVAVWGSNFPNGSGGAGHVAIVLSSTSTTVRVLTQNPGATQVMDITRSYLRGFLRPNG